MFSQLDAKHLWLNEHAYEIMYLYKYEGIMATILLLIHFISLWLTLMSLLQPCDDNCIKKNCDSTNSHASERISPRYISIFISYFMDSRPYTISYIDKCRKLYDSVDSVKDPFSYQRVQCYKQHRRYPYIIILFYLYFCNMVFQLHFEKSQSYFL